jgi:hypothetical protein
MTLLCVTSSVSGWRMVTDEQTASRYALQQHLPLTAFVDAE